MIPPFDPASGRLPPGEHTAEWHEVVERFGWNAGRARLLVGLGQAIELLAEGGCRQIWLNGSFVTAKEFPGDFDACWDTGGVELDSLDPILLDLSHGRAAQKAKFGGELFPNVIEQASGLSFAEFFQNERDTSRKGIVIVQISKGVTA